MDSTAGFTPPPGVTIAPFNPLSAPRGTRMADELTGEPAKISATFAGATFYYATHVNFMLDYDGVLSRVAPLMGQLAALDGMGGSAAERAAQGRQIRSLQHQVADACERAAQAHLVSKDFELALPPALRSMRALLALHGEGAVELVPAYLVLAEVNLGLSRATQADEFLSTASYILVKHPDASAELRSRLHRNFGRLYAAQGNHAAALESFSRDVFYGAMVHGPEAVEVTIGYFFMAQVMAAQGRVDAALVLFDKVVDVTYRHLLGERSSIAQAFGIDFASRSPAEYLGDARASGYMARSAAAEAAAAAAAKAAAARTARKSTGAGSAAGLDDASLAGSGAGGELAEGGSVVSGAGGSVVDAAGAAGGAGAGSASGSAGGAGGIPPPLPPRSTHLTESQIREGLEMLQFIAHVRATHLGARHISTAEVRYAEALVLLQAGRREEARALLASSLEVFLEHLPEDHPTIVKLRSLMA